MFPDVVSVSEMNRVEILKVGEISGLLFNISMNPSAQRHEGE